MGLDNGLYGNYSHLTGNDVKTAIKLLGKCEECMIGSMNAPDKLNSLSEPAREIGDNVGFDLIQFKETTIAGGNNVIILVDDKTAI